jgi:lipid II:glycine glycyltransferase (peptidoglycan interpeptide bridge formation enzyme)
MEAPANHFFQTQAWADVRRADGWRSELVDGPWGSYRVLVRPLPFVGRTVVDVPYGPPGPYDDPAAVRDLLAQLADWGRRTRAAVVQIHPYVWARAGDPSVAQIRAAFAAAGFMPSTERLGYTSSYVLDLTLGEDALWDGFNSRMRGAVRKCEHLGITITDGTALDAFAIRYQEMGERTGLITEPRAFFARLEAIGLRGGGLHLLEAHVEPEAVGRPAGSGTLLAGLLFSVVGRVAVALWAHSVPESGPSGANVRLHWEAMRWAGRAGMTHYDLGGFTRDAPEGSKKAGIHLFKKQFKAEMVELPGTHALVLAPGIARAAREMRRLRARIGAVAGTIGGGGREG